MNTETYLKACPSCVVVARIRFTDSGPDEVTPLHHGSYDDCCRVYATLPAVAYKGERTPKEASVEIHGSNTPT